MEVNLSPERKGNMCGLCGNYNGDPHDDMVSKAGNPVKDPYRFGMAWRKGAVSACGLTRDRVWVTENRREFRQQISDRVKLVIDIHYGVLV